MLRTSKSTPKCKQCAGRFRGLPLTYAYVSYLYFYKSCFCRFLTHSHDNRYVYLDTGKHGFLIPPHLAALFGNGPSDLTPQLCLEEPTFEASDDDNPEQFLAGFEALSVGYWDPFDESADLSLQSWLHMWANIVHGAWM